jgi:hypothetical protein
VWLERGVVHVWFFALIIAALAPWCVQLFARAIERRVRDRTDETIARADAAKSSIESIDPRATSSNVSKDRES